jgi:hypothetical protein
MDSAVCDHLGRSDDNRQTGQQRRQIQRPSEDSWRHDGDDEQQARQPITEVVKRERGTKGCRWTNGTCRSKHNDRISIDRWKCGQPDDEPEHCPNDCANRECAPRDHSRILVRCLQ